jgi:hypothetical protein
MMKEVLYTNVYQSTTTHSSAIGKDRRITHTARRRLKIRNQINHTVDSKKYISKSAKVTARHGLSDDHGRCTCHETPKNIKLGFELRLFEHRKAKKESVPTIGSNPLLL